MNGQAVWTQRAGFGGGDRYAAVGFAINTTAYLGLGADSLGQLYKDFWAWDPATDSWTQKSDFGGVERKGAVGFANAYLGKGYVGTGYNGSINPHGFLKDFWEYDPASNSWKQHSDFGGTARENAVGFCIGSKSIIGLGFDGVSSAGGITKDFWEWNDQTNFWTKKADFGGSYRQNAVSFVVTYKAYVGLGKDLNGNYKKDFWEWNILNNTWTQLSDFGGSARHSATGFSIGNYGYVGCGQDVSQPSNGHLNDFWKYDTQTNKWQASLQLPGNGRTNAVGFSMGNKAYVGTGTLYYFGFQEYFYDDFYEFNPDGNGVYNIDLTDSIRIFPNPSLGRFHISSNIKEGKASIFSLSGERLYTVVLNDGNADVDITSQPPGLYFLVITDSNGNNGVNKIIIR